jgi:TetR/AcrR family transcriptional regulator, transcriptional repressor of aconitase
MARVTQEHLDARRRQILLAAATEFGRKGLNPGAATIDDIASAAGLSKGSIYSYFENKEELYQAIIQSGIETDSAMFVDASDQSASSWEAFMAVAHQVWDYMVDPSRRELNMLSFDQMLLQLRSDEVDPRIVEGPLSGLTAMIEGAQREGDVAADLDARVLATMLWNCQQGTRAYILRTGDVETANAILDLMQDLVERTAGTSKATGEDAAG